LPEAEWDNSRPLGLPKVDTHFSSSAHCLHGQGEKNQFLF
jgi:hypothetical protein